MLSTLSLFKIMDNANYKRYINEILNEKINSGDTRHADYQYNYWFSFKLKSLKWIKFEGDEIKLEPKEIIAERVELRRQKADDEDLSDISLLEVDEEEVKEGKGLKILTPNKLLSRLPMLLAKIKQFK